MIHNNLPNSDSQEHNSIAVQKVDELVANAITTAENKTKVKSLKTDRLYTIHMNKSYLFMFISI